MQRGMWRRGKGGGGPNRSPFLWLSAPQPPTSSDECGRRKTRGMSEHRYRHAMRYAARVTCRTGTDTPRKELRQVGVAVGV